MVPPALCELWRDEAENGGCPLNENARRGPAGVHPALPAKLRPDKDIPSGAGDACTGGGLMLLRLCKGGLGGGDAGANLL